MARERLISYGLWALGGAASSFTILGAMSIGIFILPIAIAIIVFAASRRPRWPEILGLLPGVAAPILWIGVVQWRRCATAGIHMQVSNGGMIIRGHSCPSSFDPQAWLLTGMAIALIGAAAYAFALRSARAR
jgi:hypothetical protein